MVNKRDSLKFDFISHKLWHNFVLYNGQLAEFVQFCGPFNAFFSHILAEGINYALYIVEVLECVFLFSKY